MTQDALRGRFIWHELLTSDPGAAAAFYKKVVGWKTQAWPEDPNYTLLLAGTRGVGGLMQLPEEAKAMGAPPHWLSYVGTPDTDATSARLQALGGKVLKTPWDVPTVGRVAVVQDPHGAVFGLFTPSQPSGGGATTLGEFSWHELMTDDQAAALAFYADLFGWQTTESMDMGPEMGTYDMFGLDGVSMGGIMRRPPNVPANWLPYAMIPDSRKAAPIIKSLGAQILNGPMEVPGGDWIVMGVDPQGAAFAVHSLKPAEKAARPAAPAKASAKQAATKTAGKAAKAKQAASKSAATAAKKKAGKKKAGARKAAGKKRAKAPRRAAKAARKTAAKARRAVKPKRKSRR